MLDARPQETWRNGEAVYFAAQAGHEVCLGVGPRVGQGMLQGCPDSLVGIEFRCVRREQFQVQAGEAGAQAPQGSALVDLRIVEQGEDMTAEMAQQVADKGAHLVAADVGLVELAIEPEVAPAGADRDAGNGGDAVVAVPVAKNGGLSPRAPGLADGRDQHEPRLVDEDDVGRQPRGVFFTRGQAVRFHSSMRRSSRSTARRSGFWWLQPIWWRRRPT